MRSFVFLLTIIPFALQNVIACQPLSDKDWEDSPNRVKTNFDEAQFVVIAKVIDVRTVYQADPSFPDFKMKLERAKFRVERTFKGKFISGDTFVVDSGRSSCSSSVKYHGWIPFIPGKSFRPAKDYPTRWLIYYTATSEMANSTLPQSPFEITVSPLSRPVEAASYDLTILEKLGAR